MPKVNISLGRKLSGSEAVSPERKREDDMYFPSFHIETDKKLDFPHEGTMTIHFKKTGFSMRENSDGAATYSCDIEVHRIVSMYGDADSAPYKRDKSTEEALDALASKKEDDDESDY